MTGESVAMPTQTVDDRLDELKENIKRRFPETRMEFSTRQFDLHAELWIYVLQIDQFDAVKAYAKELGRVPANEDFPIWVFAKTWSGPWPGGETEEMLKRRRQEFLRNIKMENR